MPTLRELSERHAALLARCEQERDAAGARAADIAQVFAAADRGLVRLRKLPLKAAAFVVVAASTWLLARGRRPALARLGMAMGLLGSGLRLRALAGRRRHRPALPRGGGA